MPKKKRKSQQSARRVSDPLAALKDSDSPAARRINDVIARIGNPESVLEHIQRAGAEYWIAPKALDRQGNTVDKACLVVPFEGLIQAEIEHLNAGGQFGDLLGKKKPAGAGRGASGSGGESVRNALKGIRKITEVAKAAADKTKEQQKTNGWDASKSEPISIVDKRRVKIEDIDADDKLAPPENAD